MARRLHCSTGGHRGWTASSWPARCAVGQGRGLPRRGDRLRERRRPPARDGGLLGQLQTLERGHGTDGDRPTGQARSIRALIADPDESLLRSYREWLAAVGFEVVTAANGLECLAHLRNWVPDILV